MTTSSKNAPLTKNQIVKERIVTLGLTFVAGVALGTIAYHGAKSGARDYLASGKLKIEINGQDLVDLNKLNS